MFTRRLTSVLLIAALALALAGCGGKSNKSQATSDKVKRGGTLIVALSNNPKNLDPMIQNDSPGGEIVSQIVEGLYNYDENSKPVPWLADKIDISPDGLTYTFALKQGVKFHDGTEMDADAVKFSMDRVRNNPKSPGYSDGKEIVQTTAVDKYTFRFTLKEPFSAIPSMLTGRLGGVVSPTAVKAMGEEKFNTAPVGTGPFKFGEWKQDNYVRVTKFADYWGKGADGQPLPYLDGVEWRIITESSNRAVAIQAGDVQIASPGTSFGSGTGVREADIPALKNDSSIVIQQAPGRAFAGIFFTISKAPFDNKALRQAVAFAIDRDEIVKVIYNNNRLPANGPIPPSMGWAVDTSFKPYSTDLTKAKQKLTEGGQPNGFSFEYMISAGDSIGQTMAELMQAQLAKAGIKMNIKAVDFNGVLVPAFEDGTSNAYALAFGGGVDPEQYVASPFQKDGGFNLFPYENERVEALIKQTRGTSDLEKRGQAFKEATKIIADDSPIAFTVYGIDRYVGRKNVKGWYVGLQASTGYAQYWLDGK